MYTLYFQKITIEIIIQVILNAHLHDKTSARNTWILTTEMKIFISCWYTVFFYLVSKKHIKYISLHFKVFNRMMDVQKKKKQKLPFPRIQTFSFPVPLVEGAHTALKPYKMPLFWEQVRCHPEIYQFIKYGKTTCAICMLRTHKKQSNVKILKSTTSLTASVLLFLGLKFRFFSCDW